MILRQWIYLSRVEGLAEILKLQFTAKQRMSLDNILFSLVKVYIQPDMQFEAEESRPCVGNFHCLVCKENHQII